MSAEIHNFPSVYNPATGELVPPVEVLENAKTPAPADVAIVTRLPNGEIEVWASHADMDATMGLLTRGLHWLANRKQTG